MLLYNCLIFCVKSIFYLLSRQFLCLNLSLHNHLPQPNSPYPLQIIFTTPDYVLAHFEAPPTINQSEIPSRLMVSNLSYGKLYSQEWFTRETHQTQILETI